MLDGRVLCDGVAIVGAVAGAVGGINTVGGRGTGVVARGVDLFKLSHAAAFAAFGPGDVSSRFSLR